MTCEECLDWVEMRKGFIQEAPFETRRAVILHLKGCPTCTLRGMLWVMQTAPRMNPECLKAAAPEAFKLAQDDRRRVMTETN